MTETTEIKVPLVEPAEQLRPQPTREETSSWQPKTSLGMRIKSGEITDIDTALELGGKIREAEIVDVLLPGMESDLLMIGQSKGKFGGGQRRVFKQTQRKTMEGNKPSFATMAVVGNKNGYVGLGYGKARETVPAREKALRTAKLNVFSVIRGCGSWECSCKAPHSIPFKVSGKVGSVKIELIPAPKGKGLIVEKECQKVLALAGIRDVWSVTRGQTGIKGNLLKACIKALKQLSTIKVNPADREKLGMIEGRIQTQ